MLCLWHLHTVGAWSVLSGDWRGPVAVAEPGAKPRSPTQEQAAAFLPSASPDSQDGSAYGKCLGTYPEFSGCGIGGRELWGCHASKRPPGLEMATGHTAQPTTRLSGTVVREGRGSHDG